MHQIFTVLDKRSQILSTNATLSKRFTTSRSQEVKVCKPLCSKMVQVFPIMCDVFALISQS